MKKKRPFFSRAENLPSSECDVIVKPASTKGWVVEMLDPAKLIAYWHKARWYPLAPTMTPEILGHDFPFDVDPERMHSLVGCIERGMPLPAIVVGSWSHEQGQGLNFPDGRHRIVLFEAMGLTSIPALILNAEAELAMELAGADELDPRVQVEFPLRSPRPRF